MQHMTEFFGNPVFSGGLGLAALAVGATALRTSSRLAADLLKRNFLITLEVTSKDRSYPWVLQWLASQGRRTQHLSVDTVVSSRGGAHAQMKFDFVPGPGQHFLRYKGTYLSVQRIREQSMMDLNSGKPWEKILFLSVGSDTSVFESILSEAYESASRQEEGKLVVYTNWGSEWRVFGQPRRRRPLHSVILDEGVSQRIHDDVLAWQSASAWYLERGIPYRRGYLLHGPPGSGKTSYIMALAGKLEYNICIMSLSERGLTDDRLALAMSTVPPNSVVLFEDIDAAFPSRDSSQRAPSSLTNDITLSGLLNTLDGIASSEERLIFMTTNYVHRLDPALIRPGRVDVMQEIGDATPFQVGAMFRRFFPDDPESTRLFCDSISGLRVSMAQLQEHFLTYRESAAEAIANVDSLHRRSQFSFPPAIDSESTEEKRRQMAIKRAARGPISAAEADRMVFNPQPGWDKDLAA